MTGCAPGAGAGYNFETLEGAPAAPIGERRRIPYMLHSQPAWYEGCIAHYPVATMTIASLPAPARKTRLGSFVAGLGTLMSIWPTASAPVRYPHRSEADALRGDAYRIGADMRHAIECERAALKTTSE